MKVILFNICFVLIGLTAFTACNNGGSTQNTTEQTTVKADSSQQTGSDLAAAEYSCPMHPEVTSNEPGKCSKCGMNLEKVAAADHEHTDGDQH
ncbi:heavy metal-binding domain-containing protein [Adhaeribacter radiodurans]|uniref:Heavy metal binding domain-containing protein n=1 Tax=Adhaeribacter radiodurans TaxID=2745197 RepID=A0A7L7L5W9_9BACT|nr:heavy metal-binding domain-containing protein [Adhaeribacter radiodurans]QMU28217.1 hypothetical protein HUW48_09265 [Adhaeribacter radiodurans]